MEVGVWLRSLGLGQYETAFRDNGVEVDVLPDLDDGDLEKLGVLLGHRKRLRKAIANLGAAPAPAAPAPAAATESAERRHLTVMFCDLVGSTGISAKLDAEDWRDLVGGYLDAASAAVTRMGGHVAKKLGDGLMALFGYPLAQENDAERALRAALEIFRALAEINSKNASAGRPRLEVRIGVETGAVVVDSTGEVFGDAPNVAARVQAAAEPGSVWTTGKVRRQVAGLFVAEDRGAHELKGVPEPVTLFRIVRASGGGRRSGQRALTPLVGREEELTLLLRRWERARAGEGQFVQIVAEPGLGKSRLIEEFRARLIDTPHTWVEWASSQLLQNTPLHPIADWGRQRFGGADIPAARRLADLETALQAVKLDPAEHLPLLAPLLDMPLPEDRAAKFAPEELRRRQMAAMLAWVTAGAKAQPLVLAFEDLHWADPTTLDLMKSFAERGALAPLFVVATTRPEFRAPWGARSHHGTITLTPLDRRQVASMVAELAAKHAFSQAIVDGVSERTGGVPLFVEEVTRLLLERGDQGGAHAIPPTLAQSLSARLDRLGAAREVAMIGAVLGREFSFSLLRAVAGIEDLPLQQALEKLADADIVLVEGLPPEAEYRFKHALIQDAAYENLLKSRRQALHRKAAETLRDGFPEQAAARPEVLAHHFTEGGQTEAAIEWWGKAGDSALRRSAFPEAIAHLGRAIEMADKGGSPTVRPAARLDLQLSLSNATMQAHGQHASETKATFLRARELAAAVDDQLERVSANYGLWVGSWIRGETRAMQEIAAAMMKEAEAWPGSSAACIAYRVTGITCWQARGDFVAARAHLEQAVAFHDFERDRELAFRFGQDIGVMAMDALAQVRWAVGEVDQARAMMDEAIALADSIGHVPSLAHAYWHQSVLEYMRLDAGRSKSAAETSLALANKHGLGLWLRIVPPFRSWAVAALNKGDPAAWDQLRLDIEAGREQGNKGGDWLLPHLALSDALAGRPEIALRTIQSAIDDNDRLHFSDSELHRARGDILLIRDPANPEPAEQAYLDAVAVAQRQGARSFGLRAALKLAKLYQSTARPVEAHDVLSVALEGFAPTPEMLEIEEGLGLLAALGETEEWKSAAASRERRLKLQTSYGQAMAWSKGFAAEETKAAIAQTERLAAQSDDVAERLKTHYARWVALNMGGELVSAHEAAEGFLRDAKLAGDAPAAASAGRALGQTCLFQGRFAEARKHLRDALRIYNSGWDVSVRRLHGIDSGISANALIAWVAWCLGDATGARAHFEAASTEALATEHAPTIANAFVFKSALEMTRGDAEATLAAANVLLDVSERNSLRLFQSAARLYLSWARARLGATDGLAQFRGDGETLVGQGNRLFAPIFLARRAELEAEQTSGDEALSSIDRSIELANEGDIGFTDSLLRRIRGDILLKLHPDDPAPAVEAYLAAIAVAREQGARAFGLQAALKLAKLYQSTARPVEAHDILAPALEGFEPTPEMPEIAEGQALLAALAETEEWKSAATSRDRRLKLQTGYGHAMAMSRGFASEEAKVAFARVRELAAGTENAAERFDALWGQWIGSLFRGELGLARELAEIFVRETTGEAWMTEAGVARRMLGATCLWRGDFGEARTHLEEALRSYDSKRDRGAEFRFGLDTGASATFFLAHARWQLGEVGRARELIEDAVARAVESAHAPTQTNAYCHKALFEIFRGDAAATLGAAQAVVELSREHGLANFLALGKLSSGWARARLGERALGVAELQQTLSDYMSQGNKIFAPLFQGRLAEFEAEGQDADGASSRIDAALVLAVETGERWTDALLHQIRGDILLRLDAANAAPAEAAYLAAIAVAREQGARGFGLQAALKLANLYQSTARPVEAHDVLGVALEGFAPTPEMPEIAEGWALRESLAVTEDVKAGIAKRRRRLHLQTAYSQATMMAKGFASDEAEAAFARATELAAGADDFEERFAASHGQWTLALVRGEQRRARQMASAFLKQAEDTGRIVEAGVARRGLALSCYISGDFLAARTHCERALDGLDPRRDRETRERFSEDTGALAMSILAVTLWQLGEVERAREWIDKANQRAGELDHAPSMGHPLAWKTHLGILGGDPAAALRSAEALASLSREHGMPYWRARAEFEAAWARGHLDDAAAGAEELRRALAIPADQGGVGRTWFLQVLLAEIEALALGPDSALARIDEALTDARQTENRCNLPFAHRLRGELLAKRDPSDPAAAEDAFLTAIAIAREQGARSHGLLAAFELAKLYQSTVRPIEAHRVLASALEGFEPTPEMPEIEEAFDLKMKLSDSTVQLHGGEPP
jgi:class 3 adenylate cyclase/tetratricopeptide (TPR) repeat protein